MIFDVHRLTRPVVRFTVLVTMRRRAVEWARSFRGKALDSAFSGLRRFQSLQTKDQRDALGLALALVVVAIYFPVAGFGFVGYDDPAYVTHNPHVNSGLSWKGIWWSLTALHGDVAYWHPLTWISHQLDFQLFGSNAGAHHLTSVLLHAANTVWVFLIARRLLGNLTGAFLVALFFAIHPLRVESVAWISERKDVLCAFFYFATIHFYFRYAEESNWKRYLTVFGCFVLALMSKPMAVTLPCALLLLDVWPLGRLSGFRSSNPVGDGRWRTSDPRAPSPVVTQPAGPLFTPFIEKIPFFVATAVVAFLAVKAQQDLKAIMPSEVMPLPERLANAAVSYAAYLHKTILPIRLSVHYNHPFIQPLWLVTLSAAALSCITALLVRSRHHRPILLFGWLWYLGTLVPAIGVVQAGSQSMADRYTYIPALGLTLMWPTFIEAVRRRRGLAVRFVPVGVIASALALAGTAVYQLGHWKNTRSLFKQALRVDPFDYLAHTNLGKAYQNTGDKARAMIHFQAAIFANPSSSYPKVNLGKLLLGEGKPVFALPFLLEALTAGDRIEHITHSRLGDAYSDLGDFEKAMHHYREAVRLKPRLTLAKVRLAEILATCPEDRLRDGAQAVQLALEARQEAGHTHWEFESTLAAAHAEKGDFDIAVTVAESAAKAAQADGKPSLEKELRERLDLIRQKKPLRQTVMHREVD